LRVAAYIGLIIGLAVAIALIAWRGLDTVSSAMEALGVGVLVLPLIYAPHIFGAAIIIAANIYVAHREHQLGKALPPALPPEPH
jgi:hypothetical protein